MKAVSTKTDDEQVAAWWRAYRDTGDQTSRSSLLEHYLPLVRDAAARLHARVPREVDVDDLASCGVFGLIQAVEAYDPDRGARFETYSAPRIRGAMLDGLRAGDWAPRLVRSRARKLADAVQSLQARLERAPTREELAKALAIRPEHLEKFCRDARPTGVFSLADALAEGDDARTVCLADVLHDSRAADPRATALRLDLHELLTHGLSRTERLVVLLYYIEEMTMKEIGEVLGLSEGRISQMHTEALSRLRRLAAPDAAGFPVKPSGDKLSKPPYASGSSAM